jgi:hypothetical protein
MSTARNRSGQARIDALHQAAALYSGSLLESLETDWPDLDTLRQATRRQAISVLARLAQHYEHSDPARAADLLETALDHDPTHQPTAALLIRLHIRNTHPELARHTYTRLAEHLAALDQSPDKETTAALRVQPPPNPPKTCRP